MPGDRSCGLAMQCLGHSVSPSAGCGPAQAQRIPALSAYVIPELEGQPSPLPWKRLFLLLVGCGRRSSGLGTWTPEG